MNKLVVPVVAGAITLLGIVALITHQVGTLAGSREMTVVESTKLSIALQELCNIDLQHCADLVAKDSIKYLVLDKSWLPEQLDKLFAMYDGVVDPVDEGYTITLNEITFDAPAQLRVILYHEHLHVLTSDPSLYALDAPSDSWERCADHNLVKETVQNTFSRHSDIEKSELALEMKEYSLTSHGNTLEDCTNKVKSRL